MLGLFTFGFVAAPVSYDLTKASAFAGGGGDDAAGHIAGDDNGGHGGDYRAGHR